jgi:hypothetical protein
MIQARERTARRYAPGTEDSGMAGRAYPRGIRMEQATAAWREFTSLS